MLNDLDRQTIKLLWRLRRQLSDEFKIAISLTDENLFDKLQMLSQKSSNAGSKAAWHIINKQIEQNQMANNAAARHTTKMIKNNTSQI